MEFNPYNFKVAMEIAEEFGIDKDLVKGCHLGTINHPFTRDLVEYIIDPNNSSSPCKESIKCDTCPYLEICVVKHLPRDESIEIEMQRKHGLNLDSYMNGLKDPLKDLFGSLGAGNILDLGDDKKN